MTIDTNCHLGNWPFRKLEYADAEGLLRLMDRHGVDQAWVGAFEGVFYRDCAQGNRDLLASLAGHEDRLRPWAAINPAFPAWETDLQEALAAAAAGGRGLGAVGQHEDLGDLAIAGPHHGGDGPGLGAGALGIGDVLDIAAGVDSAIVSQQRCPDLEARIGRIGARLNGGGSGEQRVEIGIGRQISVP